MVKPKATIEKEICLACGGCVSVCAQDAITIKANKAIIEKEKCISCEICITTCPVAAIHWEGK
ncbi:MAG: 4Fe-4S binding protein [Thermoplasmatota archaeon]